MTAIEHGFLLTRDSHDHSRHTEIILWVTTPQGPARLVIEGEQPVFLLRQDQAERAEQALDEAGITTRSRPLDMHTFAHQPVVAFYFLTLDRARKARRLLKERGLTLYEADIRLQDHYLTERFVYGSLEFTGQPRDCGSYTEYRRVRVRPGQYQPSFRVVSLDIECSAKGELYSVGLSGQSDRQDNDGLVIMIGPQPARLEGDTAIHWVENEAGLLTALVEILGRWDPDIIIGWNVINFDFRLLLKRAERHNITLLLGRGEQDWQKRVHWRERAGENEQGFITIPGRVVIDGIESLRAATWHFDSFSLEFVARTLLGKGKDTEDVDNRMAIITHDFHHNKEKLARYNLEDCRLVQEVFDHTRLLDYLRLRSQLTGLELDRLGGSVAAFTNLYLPKLHRAGYIAPNLPEGGGLASPGGYVMDSLPGLYDNVLVLDFKSLYPSIIRTFLVDPLGLVEGLKEPEEAVPGFRGALFSREKHFLPEIIRSLWAQRDEAKREKDAARSQALKIIMNSFYGVLGSGGCRFYDTRLASSITMRGHAIMQQTARWIEEQGYQVIYGDTDSTFVHLGAELSEEQADNVGRELEQMINTRWRQTITEEFQLESYLELEFETLYTRFLMPTIRGMVTGSKKRYAGLKKNKDGTELVFKGLETVRSDWTDLAKTFQIALFEKVFAGESPEQLVQDAVAETLAGKHDDQLIYRKRLRRRLDEYVKNVPPHVRAARRADELNRQHGKPERYQHKGWISYVITVAGPEAVEWQQSPVDYQHYIDKQLQPVADGVLPFVGLDFLALVDNQQGLF
ncbi:DNA polymerase II [Parendozoicomonas haliclonae]|uniref:DNA polymerase n=1 Tax=Parendozoicomonas haliclonae TaxID=1960125 RepID=A0A1X7AMG3_9GAMM|nr:DNA polymerase II [Parendozoicomonas haliclonae]SMA49410.1 DNA polymerase II [Parendozoicomonas haliclonae]